MFPRYIFKCHCFITNTFSLQELLAILFLCAWTGRSQPPLFLLWCCRHWEASKNLSGCRQCRAGGQISQFHAALGQLSPSPSHLSRDSPEVLVEEDGPQPTAQAAPGPEGSGCFSKGLCTELTWASLWGSPVRCSLQTLHVFHRSLVAMPHEYTED